MLSVYVVDDEKPVIALKDNDIVKINTNMIIA